MEFFDKITKTASKTYKYTTEKTGRLAKEVKLKAMMNQDKEKISEIYEQIGKKVYESHIREYKDDVLGEVEELCNQIDAYSKEIEFSRMELLRLRDLKQCPNCDYEIALDFHFCPNCGVKQEEDVSSDVNVVQDVFCAEEDVNIEGEVD